MLQMLRTFLHMTSKILKAKTGRESLFLKEI